MLFKIYEIFKFYQRFFLFIFLISLSSFQIFANPIKKIKKPNVIYILCDDLGYGEVGYNGQKLIKTPELDELANKGMKFTDHYCGNAVCAPSRASLLTGKHPGHAYIRSNSPGYPDGQTPILAESETIGKLMQRAGYNTACIGKWGLGGFNNSGNPNKQGFDFFYGYTDQRKAHNYYPKYLWLNGEKQFLDNDYATKNDYSHDLFTKKALGYIQENKDHPFFLYLAYTIPHLQWQVPDYEQYENKDWPKNMKIQAAMISRMSKDVGRLSNLLERLKLDEKTLIIFSSDNGAHGKGETLKLFKSSGDLRGKKRDMYDGGVRSPTFAYWPGTIQEGEVSDHISAFWDVLPTLSELTGEPIIGKSDGISMMPTLFGNSNNQKQHTHLYWELYESKPNCAVRYGEWKAVVNDRRKGYNIELYNIKEDEKEENNLANKYPEVLEKIRKLMISSHVKNDFWDVDFSPLYNAEAACDYNGVEPDVSYPWYKPQKKNNK